MTTNTKKILIAEDDPFLVKFYKAKLEQKGFSVHIEGSGENILPIIKAEHPDLFVLDLGLPGKNGFEILQEVRANAETKNTPVFVVTKLAGEEDRKRTEELGATLYLCKMETGFEELIKDIERYLNTGHSS